MPAPARFVGSHLSITDGFDGAAAQAGGYGMTSLQIFSKSQKTWRGRDIMPDEVTRFAQARTDHRVNPVIVHASYLINLGAPVAEQRTKGIEATIDELNRCAMLGIDRLVMHPGSHVGTGEEAGIGHIVESLDLVAPQRPKGVTLLLEVTAGQGSSIGHDFAHIGRILREVKDASWLGVCLDTCHLWAAGHDIGTKYDDVRRQMEQQFGGLDRIGCIHVNDSVKPFNSRVDRHAHLGLGTMGRDAFRPILQDAAFHGTPLILETPKGENEDGDDWDALNTAVLLELCGVAVPAAKKKPAEDGQKKKVVTKKPPKSRSRSAD